MPILADIADVLRKCRAKGAKQESSQLIHFMGDTRITRIAEVRLFVVSGRTQPKWWFSTTECNPATITPAVHTCIRSKPLNRIVGLVSPFRVIDEGFVSVNGLSCCPTTRIPFARERCAPAWVSRSFDDAHQPFGQFAPHHVVIHQPQDSLG